MSDSIERYQIEITSAHVPDNLMGTPLPVEIVSTTGFSKRALLTLGSAKPVMVTVEKPGRYTVRAELPSGLWLLEQGVVPTHGAIPSPTIIVLDFGAEGASPLQSQIPNLLGRRLGVGMPRFAPIIEKQTEDPVRDFLPPIQIDGGEFVKWGTHSEGAAQTKDSLLIHQRISTQLDRELPAKVALKLNAPWRWDSPRNWRPCLVVADVSRARGQSTRILAMWPWLADDQALSLLPDSPPASDPERPPVLAMCGSGNRTVDALFSFIRGGALDSARQAAPTLISLAESFLREKEENPVLACVAAYTLFKIGSLNRMDWVANLADRFPFIPDGAVIHGWNLLHAGKAPEARDYFHRALERGLPMYTIGIRLLRDGLNFVRGLYPDDARVQIDATRASRLASFANLDSELTCIRLDKGFSVRFEQGAPVSPR